MDPFFARRARRRPSRGARSCLSVCRAICGAPTERAARAAEPCRLRRSCGTVTRLSVPSWCPMSSFLRALSGAPASLPAPAHDLHALLPDPHPARGPLHADVCVAGGGARAGGPPRDPPRGRPRRRRRVGAQRRAGARRLRLSRRAPGRGAWRQRGGGGLVAGARRSSDSVRAGGRSSAPAAVPARAVVVAAARFEALAPGLADVLGVPIIYLTHVAPVSWP